MTNSDFTHRPGDAIGAWILIDHLDIGKNGVVWRAQNADGSLRVAIKFLNKMKKTALARFRDEVQVMRALNDVPGVLPILDAELTTTTPWFAMPLAERLDVCMRDQPVSVVVEQFASLASTLAQLHERKIVHRDIKPANLLRFEGKPVIGDFGIARFPRHSGVTKLNNAIGPGPTMAPEMRHYRPGSDARPADVFGLAKSLWIFLTGHEQGFEGEYSASQRHILMKTHAHEHLAPLHRIFAGATTHDPAARPSAATLAQSLRTWVETIQNIGSRAPEEWLAVEREIFPHGIPGVAEWDHEDEICSVLSRIGESPIASHVFFPSGGGLDITGASVGPRRGTIELEFGIGSVVILKPRRLSFRRIDTDRTSDFFILEAADTSLPEGWIQRDDSPLIDFTELPSGLLIDAQARERNEWEGNPLPDGARGIAWCRGGKFLFVMRTSSYNAEPDTYDARHQRFTPDEIATALTQYGANKSLSEEVERPVFVSEDLGWQDDKSRRPGLLHVSIDQVIRLIRHWPHHYRGGKLSPALEADSCVDQYSWDDQLTAYAAQRKRRAKWIHSTLGSLSDDALRELITLMYVGRDQANYPLSKPRWEWFLSYHSKNQREEIIRTLLEKASVPRYLADGLRSIGAYRLKSG